MKKFLLSLAVMLLTVIAFAQEKTVVGTWKIVRIQSEEVDIDLQNKATLKAFVSKIFEAQGQQADSAQVEQFAQIMTKQFEGARMIFNANGECEYLLPGEGGQTKSDKASYTVDYAKKIMYTTSKSTGKKEEVQFSFENDRLVVHEKDSKETISLVRSDK